MKQYKIVQSRVQDFEEELNGEANHGWIFVEVIETLQRNNGSIITYLLVK